MLYRNEIVSGCTIAMVMSFSSLVMAADYSEFAVMPTGSNDSVTIDASGNLYVAHAGNFNADGLTGTTVRKVALDGTISDYVTGLSGPLGTDFDTNGNLYIANFNTGELSKVTPEGVKTSFSTLGNASGIVINSQDEIFVSSYNENAIYKVSSAGNAQLWLQDNGLNGPVGIVLDESENIYVGNYNDGKVFKIDSNKIQTELNSAPDNAGYITYAHGMIYTTGINTNKIYQIPVAGGDVEELAGSAEAGFLFPNGITASENGTKLFVSNFESDQIIVIENFVDHAKVVPKAEDDSATVEQDTPVVIDILLNDDTAPATLDLASVDIVTFTQNGNTSVDNATGAITYTPTAGYSGTDNFVYTVSNTNGDNSNEANVVITVTAKAAVTPVVSKSSGSGGGSFGFSLLLILLLNPVKSGISLFRKVIKMR